MANLPIPTRPRDVSDAFTKVVTSAAALNIALYIEAWQDLTRPLSGQPPAPLFRDRPYEAQPTGDLLKVSGPSL